MQGYYQQQQAPQQAPPSQGHAAHAAASLPQSASPATEAKPSFGERFKTFVKAHFDFSFTTFTAPSVLKVLYGVALVAGILYVLGMSLMGMYAGITHQDLDFVNGKLEKSWDPQFGTVVVAFMMIPIGIPLQIIFQRLIFETLMVRFRQYEVNRDLLETMKQQQK